MCAFDLDIKVDPLVCLRQVIEVPIGNLPADASTCMIWPRRRGATLP